MDKAQIIELLREYKKLVQKHFDLDRLVLFGSYSRGEQNTDSDSGFLANVLETGLVIE